MGLVLSTVAPTLQAHTVTNKSVGCKNQSDVGPAIVALNKGGFSGFMPYVKKGCLMMLVGYEADIAKKTATMYLVNYKSPSGPVPETFE